MMSVPVLLVGLCVVSAHVKDDVHISKMLGEESHLERDLSTVPDPSAAIEQTIHPIKPEDATGVFDGPPAPWQQQWNSHILMAPDQLQKIMSVVRPDSNVLVFGAGYDSKLWSSGPNMVQSKGMAPPSGRTLIIEDDDHWIQKVEAANPEVDVRKVAYHSQLLDQQSYKDDEELLKADFPVDELGSGKDTRKWDVIIVDAPQAFKKTTPGRMKSIYWASKLVKNDGYVFLHDFNRGTEQWFSKKYLATELDQGCSGDEDIIKGKKGDLGCFGPAIDAKARDEKFATAWLSAKPLAAKPLSAHTLDNRMTSQLQVGKDADLFTIPDPSAAIEETDPPIKPDDASEVYDGPLAPWQLQWNKHILMAPNQISKIISVIRPDSQVLVFGAGYDSKLWSSGPNMVQTKGMAPPSGRTLILEDDPDWIQRVNTANPEVDVRPVGYHTTLLDQQRYKDDEELLKADFPVEQLGAGKDTRAWDVVIVDAPQAFMKTTPGRMKSIYWASKLVKNTGYVFVHDFNRGTEQWFANKYLVPEFDQGCSADEATIKGKKGDLGCFGPAKDAKARDEEFATSWLSAKAPEAVKAKPL